MRLDIKVPTQYIKRETFDEKDINTVVREIDAILLGSFTTGIISYSAR